MKRIAICFLPMSLSSPCVHAQSEPASESPFSEHSQALQFSIGDNFALHQFQGATIAYKHHIQPLTAYRVGLGISFGGSANDNTSSGFTDGSLSSGSAQTTDAANISIQIGGQKIWYMEGPHEIFFYFGGGPYLGMGYHSTTQEYTPLSAASSALKSTTESTAREYTGGVSALAGVECFAAKGISLHAEYGVNVLYSWTKNESSSQSSPSSYSSTTDNRTSAWQFSSPGVVFGLSVYF